MLESELEWELEGRRCWRFAYMAVSFVSQEQNKSTTMSQNTS